MTEKEVDIETLVGETIVDIDDVPDEAGDDRILITTANGRTIVIYHQQGCCERVRIIGRDGEWHTLIGKVIVEARKDQQEQQDSATGYGTATKTELMFRVDDATVVSRWIGESNGHYSERVDIKELFKKFGDY